MTLEQEDRLKDVATSPAGDAVAALLDHLVSRQKQALGTISASIENKDALFIAAAKAEGAQQLAQAFKTELVRIRRSEG